ncbi:hypothetical protein RhiirA5_413992 [Rhizophagus irregularis]|nr:hypothetical protein RhiirA5_413992 [Rhizophagus irregularis]PKC63285.1 hypothetical protein RhiirA1_463958 [Rhizophagus irregularis]PKY21326.1 hypothetical protein RhiirB3_434879 [Rhizophagus irregularis]PKY51686.1 hypothetical protein RhiirA4_468857 [Rhizophagus irregularis]CAB4433359.1 unnamed protein product [Rhizophagus irregularis]
MKFTYLTTFIYFILSLSSLSAAIDETFTLTGLGKRGGSMTQDSGIFCLTYKGDITTTTVTLVEEVNNGADIRLEEKVFLNDGNPHSECWPFHASGGKLFHFDYKLNGNPMVSVTFP